MWVIPLACLVLIVFGAVWLGSVPPPHANTLFRTRAGGVRAARGNLVPHAREQLTAILSEAGGSRGFIAITSDDRVNFSRHIPVVVHQCIRNVLLNKWA